MPDRGFEGAEYQARLDKAQALMQDAGLNALLLTTAPEIYYFSGFLTRFWESPTRPWFVIIPATGKPCAVIPSIGATLMGQSWIEDIRTWPAPRPDDEGVSLLAQTIQELCGVGARIGVPSGPETQLRMPIDDFEKLRANMPSADFVGDSGLVRRLRQIKSAAEIAKIRQACEIGGRAFQRVPEIAGVGIPLDQVFRQFQQLCLEEGGDWVPYLAGAGEAGGYRDVISPAHYNPLRVGDVLMLDTGLVWDGYFCDFNRNWSLGRPSEDVSSAHACLIDATEAGLEAVKPGIRAWDIYYRMKRVLGDTSLGRLGHGLGMSLTEWPSLMESDDTELVEGMVITLEPVIEFGGKIMVHEENIVITAAGAERLTPKTSPNIPILP